MDVNIGFIQSESQVSVKSINYNDLSVESNLFTPSELKELDMNLLFFSQEINFEPMAEYLAKEEGLYPIVDISSVGHNKDSFEDLDPNSLKDVFSKINNRWILSQNIQTIENLFESISNLKTLWAKDRHQFFTEFWKVLKNNLATNELTIIFNDVKEPTKEQEEKGAKPSLINSFISGKKTANIMPGSDAQAALMDDYSTELKQSFNITEYNSETGNLVICGSIDQSPILLMAKLPTFNQLQRSVIISLFSGLNS